jgi:hypothetical protein
VGIVFVFESEMVVPVQGEIFDNVIVFYLIGRFRNANLFS